MDEVHAIKGRVNHMYLIEGDRLTLIDPEFPSSVDRVFRFVTNTLGRKLTDIKLVCVTHAHLDHIGGLEKVVSKTGAKVALPLTSRDYIEGRKAYKITVIGFIARSFKYWSTKTKKSFSLSSLAGNIRLPTLMDLITMNIVGFPPFPHRFKVKVNFWLKDSDHLPLNPSWKIMSSPGHSDDSVCFYSARTKSLIPGDLIVNLNERPCLNPIVLPDKDKALKSLKKLRRLEVDRLYPGCGQPIIKKGVLDLLRF